MDDRMRGAFYATSNSLYGWKKQNTSEPPSKSIERALERQHLTEEDKAFNRSFWKSTNQEYGSFGFEKNSLCKAVDELHVVSRAKHVIPPERGPVTPVSKHKGMKLSFENYSAERKEEHKIYSTSANEIGAKKPHFDTSIFPHSNEFTKTFLAGMQRDCGLNTTVTKNRFIE